MRIALSESQAAASGKAVMDEQDPVIREHIRRITLEGKARETIRKRRQTLERISRHLPVPLLEATEEHLLAWREELGDLAPATIGGYLSMVREFYRWAVRAGKLAASPAEDLPGPKRPRRLPRPIDYADLVRAVESAKGDLRAQLVLAAWAGLRACELARLRKEFVQLAGKNPHVFIAADATKGRGERTVPLSPYAVAELQAYRPPPAGEWYFGRPDGERGHMSPWHVSQRACQWLHDCGITATLHQCRHWFGTEFYEASGCDLRATQEVMGHVSPESTALYTRVRPARAAAAAARMPAPKLLRAVS